ncbi:MAG TPA: bifunctional phosphopantothenoylcysteine decarboxylase/phosphopantothenate--cysteine ligase CoaBC, partial [Flavitalea sp.]|nr:bifunctional phosphopantothenoylcysteine decarboxylase/phosphopantothenate--cysteine ligase CoaBC [Flavitalea sp.]
TLSTLSKNPVTTQLFDEVSWSNHVMLGRWADVMVVAPLTCNTLAKMATGICDNMLLATYLSSPCPVVVAPAMDEDMWHHPTVVKNLDQIRSYGNKVIPVEEGELASGLFGKGRMAEPEEIISFLEKEVFAHRDLEGKKALVTAGPTFEPIDPVRFIGNHSSGKMGVAIAHELAARGAAVTLVLGPSHEKVDEVIDLKKVNTAQEMYDECLKVFPDADIAVMSAAVADYTPSMVSEEKIKKQNGHLTLELTKTRDILKQLGEMKSKQLLVGFALETNNEEQYAKSKLQSKNADLIILNSLKDEGAGFGVDTNKITIFRNDGMVEAYPRKPKQQVAGDIVDSIVKMME